MSDRWIGRWRQKKNQIDAEIGSYDLCTIQDRLDQLDPMNDWDLQMEVADLEDRLKQTELYQDLEFKKMQLKAHKELREVSEKLVVEYMLNNDIANLEWNGSLIKLKVTNSVSTEIEDINQVPEEFRRLKFEVDKVSVKKLYTETGVMTAGVNFKHNKSYKLEVKNDIR